jgi:hypothetical protein
MAPRCGLCVGLMALAGLSWQSEHRTVRRGGGVRACVAGSELGRGGGTGALRQVWEQQQQKVMADPQAHHELAMAMRAARGGQRHRRGSVIGTAISIDS